MLYEVVCVVHVHSEFSDGRASIGEILDAARETGADSVLLTDHDTLAARHRGLEGWHEGVLLLVGVEISPRGGHFLAFGMDRELDHAGMTESQIAAAVRRAGALGFAAHPFSAGSRMSSVIGRPHPWGALDSDDYTGIELWSLETEAAEGWRSLREAIAFMRDPESALKGPSQRNLAAWDELCERRRVVGIGGLDAHETGLRVGRRVLSPFPNGRFFRFLRTHVLVEEPLTGRLEPDRAAVYGALSEGRCFLAMDAIADGRGFTFHAEAARGRKLEMGAEAEAGAEWVMEARSPRRAELRLLTGGAELARAAEAFTLRCRISTPGAYRVEAWRERRRWIVSNPIYLRADGGSAHADGSGHEP